jgi:hypothetical protein
VLAPPALTPGAALDAPQPMEKPSEQKMAKQIGTAAQFGTRRVRELFMRRIPGSDESSAALTSDRMFDGQRE